MKIDQIEDQIHRKWNCQNEPLRPATVSQKVLLPNSPATRGVSFPCEVTGHHGRKGTACSKPSQRDLEYKIDLAVF